MKIKTPLDRERIKTHLTYHFWIYILVIVASIFGWNLLYTMTAYKSPEDKRIDLYIQSSTASQQSVEEFIKPIWEKCVPDMEVVDAVMLMSNSQDYYSNMQLTVYIMAQEGDIYILNSYDYKTFASQGVFADLSPYVEGGQLNLDGIDLSSGYIALTDENGLPVGERKLLGIPLQSLYGYIDGMGMDNRDLMLGVTVFNGNESNVISFLNGFIEAGRGDAPEWLENK